jgi:hypothetical protein
MLNFGVEDDDADFAHRIAGVTDHDDDDDSIFDTDHDDVDDDIDIDVDVLNKNHPSRVPTVLASNIKKNKINPNPNPKDANTVTTDPTAESITNDVSVEVIRSKLSAKKNKKSSLLSSLLAKTSKNMKKREEEDEKTTSKKEVLGSDEEKKIKNYKEKRLQDMKSLLLATGTATAATKSSRSKGKEEEVKQADYHQDNSDEKLKGSKTMNKKKKAALLWKKSIKNVIKRINKKSPS